MKKLLLALVLSAALFWQHPTQSLNNQDTSRTHHKGKHTVASIAPPAVQATAPAKVEPTPQGCEAYIPLLKQYQWDVRTAYAIMQAENATCNPATDNAGVNQDGSVDYGLFQVNSIHADMVGGNLDALKDPATNVAIAYSLYSGKGWQPWATFNSGRYLAFL